MNETTQTFARRLGERVRGADYASAIERHRPGRIRNALCWIAAFAILATPFIWSKL